LWWLHGSSDWWGCTSVDIGVDEGLQLVDGLCYLGDMLSVGWDSGCGCGYQVSGWMEWI